LKNYKRTALPISVRNPVLPGLLNKIPSALVVVGNKTDLIEQEQVSIEVGSAFAKVTYTFPSGLIYPIGTWSNV